MATGQHKPGEADIGLGATTLGTDDYPALIDLVRGASNVTIGKEATPLKLTRADAALNLMQLALKNASVKTDIGANIANAALNALTYGNQMDHAGVLSLLALLAADVDETRMYLVQAKLVPAAVGFMLSGSMACSYGATALLASIVQNVEARKRVTKEGTIDLARVVALIVGGFSLRAREKATAICRYMTDGPGAEETRAQLADVGGVEAMLELIASRDAPPATPATPGVAPGEDNMGAPSPSSVRTSAAAAAAAAAEEAVKRPPEMDSAREHAAVCLANLLSLEPNRQRLQRAKGVATLLDFLATGPGLDAKAAVAVALYRFTVDDAASAKAEEDTVAEYGTKLHWLENAPLTGPQATAMSTVESRTAMLATPTSPALLLKLLEMPADLQDAGGKKGKKGKKVALPPGVERCQQYGAGCLRHLAMFSTECKQVIANTPGGISLVLALLNSSSAATRGHAAGILSQLASIKEYANAMKDMAPQCPWLWD